MDGRELALLLRDGEDGSVSRASEQGMVWLRVDDCRGLIYPQASMRGCRIMN